MASTQKRIIKANRLLQSKVGTGQVDDRQIARCQKLIDEIDIGFEEMAYGLLDDLVKAVEDARQNQTSQNQAGKKDHQDFIDRMTAPIMQLKGQAGMFHYQLLGELSGVTLNFLESVDEIDKHVIEIMDAQCKTIDVILNKNLKGFGGHQGEALRQELYEACERYFAKKGAGRKFVPESSNDVFLVG